MKYLLLTCLFLSFFPYSLTAQNRILDSTIFNNWPQVEDGNMSNDGSYFIYTLNHQPRGSRTMAVRNVATMQEKYFEDVSAGEARFSENSKFLIFKNNKQQLNILMLAKDIPEYIDSVKEFKLIGRGKRELLILQKSISGRTDLIIRSMEKRQETTLHDIDSYWLNNKGFSIVFQSHNKLEQYSLIYLSFTDNKKSSIYTGQEVVSVTFDQFSKQMTFVDKEHIGWYYQPSKTAAEKLITNENVPDSLQLQEILFFAKNHHHLYCWLRDKDGQSIDVKHPLPDVWHYKDARLQSEQIREVGPESYLALVNIPDKHVTRLTQRYESAFFNEDVAAVNEQFVINKVEGEWGEYFWNPLSLSVHSFLKNGERKLLAANSSWITESPDGKYLYQFDSLGHNLYSYETGTGLQKHIMRQLPIPPVDSTFDTPNIINHQGLLIAGYLSGDQGVLLYDHYDIWKISHNNQLPVCLTNGYGRRNNIIFRIVNKSDREILSSDETLILSAFNTVNKQNGFYKIKVNKPANPEMLTMSDCFYVFPFGQSTLKKARDKEVYFLQRSQTHTSPNYFLTTDFKHYTPLSNVYPEQSWNWVKGELLSWNHSDRLYQGILYKPNDFDSTKRYPVIFTYYEKKSDDLHHYFPPGATTDLLNIPWFVSHGYLVFTPDIYFTIGIPGQGALNAVTSAANMLCKFKWVDSTRLGLQGHSWSGFETNYIVTHSNLFKAAVAGSGPSNISSMYNDLIKQTGTSAQFFPEAAQFRLGATLWKNRDLYIDNSPVFDINGVNTPLLLLYCKADGIVPFSQATEFFTALRMAGKKAWMLQYDEGGHSVGGKEAIDYTSRLMQFYDHYLMGKPLPEWMNYK